jgi:hypothetical protein
MENTLLTEVEDSLEVFARKPEILFDFAEKVDDHSKRQEINDEGELAPIIKMGFTREEWITMQCCVNFTVGLLAGYLQEIEGD